MKKEVCKKISLKVKNDKYLETIQRYEDELTDKEKEEIKNSSSILDFNRYNLTSLGICELLKYYLDIEKIENEIIKLEKIFEGDIIPYYILKVKIEKSWYIVDLTEDLDYFLFDIYPKYFLVSYQNISWINKRVSIENEKNIYKVLEDYNREEIKEIILELNKEKKLGIKKKEIIDLNKIQNIIDNRFNSERFIKLQNDNYNKMTYSEFFKIKDEDIKKYKNKSISLIPYSESDECLIKKMFNGENALKNKIIKYANKLKELQFVINELTYENYNNILDVLTEIYDVRINGYGYSAYKNIGFYMYVKKSNAEYYYTISTLIKTLNKMKKIKIELEEKIDEELSKNYKENKFGLSEKEIRDYTIFKEIYKYIYENIFPSNLYFKIKNVVFEERTDDEKEIFISTQNLCALETGFAVCESYSQILTFLLEMFRIDSYKVSGYYYNKENENSFRHTWNKVKIGKEYYLVDIMQEIDNFELDKKKDIEYILVKEDKEKYIGDKEYLDIKCNDDFNKCLVMADFNFDSMNTEIYKNNYKKYQKLENKYLESSSLKIFNKKYKEVTLTDFLNNRKRDELLKITINDEELKEITKSKKVIDKRKDESIEEYEKRYIKEVEFEIINIMYKYKEQIKYIKCNINDLKNYSFCIFDKLIKEVNLNRFYSYILLEIKEYPELWYYNDVENYYFENVWKKKKMNNLHNFTK